MICDFSVQKIAELQEINTMQSKITIGIIYFTLVLNYSNWLATHWSSFEEFLNENISVEGNETLLIIFCNIIREMPVFFGFSIINFEHLIEIIQPLIISSNPDLRFTAIQALIRLHDVIQVTITGILLPILQLAPEISDDIISQCLYAVFKTLRTEYTFSEETASEVANFVVPLFTDDDLDVVDGTLYIAIELQCLSAVIRDEMKDITIAGIERLLNSEDIALIANGIVHLADLLEVYPDEAVQTANEYSELIERTIFDSEHLYNAQISIVAAARLASNCQFSFTQRIIEVGVEYLNSTEPCLVATGADIFQVICPHLDPAAAHQIISNMFDIAKTCTDIPTVAKTLLNVGRIFFGFGKNMPEDIKQLGIDAMIDYISGNFEVLGGVPPETTDISVQLMVIMLNQMKFCLTKPGPEVPEIFRFTMSLLKMGDLIDEGVKYVCLRILWVMIRYDILEPDYIQMITDLTIEQFTTDLPIIFLREEAHMITLYIVKKLFTKEFIESKLDTIKQWWNYIYNNRQSTRPFAISMVQLIWVAVGQL